MRAYLTFILYGPMASFGEIAVGERRPSYSHPSKSAVLGLLAAALGVRRDEEAFHAQLASSLGFAVRVDSPGVVIRDYHTIQVPVGQGAHLKTRRDELNVRTLETILSSRDYRCDACYTCCLWGVSNALPKSLPEIAAALDRPVFQLYLGRKACPPALPMAPRVFEAPSLAAVFEERDGLYPAGLELSDKPQIFFEVDALASEEIGADLVHTVVRRDQLESRKRWQFKERNESLAFIDIKAKKTQAALGSQAEG